MAAFSSSFEAWVMHADHQLMRRVNRWRAKWLRMWMIAATRGGDGC